MLFMISLPANRKAYNGFEWPAAVGAIVEASAWDPQPACGGGLHGLVNGRGDVSLLCSDADAMWYAFESIDADGNPSDTEAICIDDHKGKCHRAIIRAVGGREAIANWLVAAGCAGVHFGTATAGDYGTATAGDYGVISILFFDGTQYRRRIAAVGENGILPNVAYRLDDIGNFVVAA
jgi:hypothetical protein